MCLYIYGGKKVSVCIYCVHVGGALNNAPTEITYPAVVPVNMSALKKKLTYLSLVRESLLQPLRYRINFQIILPYKII